MVKKVVEMEVVRQSGIWLQVEIVGKDGVKRKWIMSEVKEFREDKKKEEMFEQLG